MKTFWITKGIKIILLVAIVGAIMTYAVMLLWNWLMPLTFGASMINFWEAAGLLVLAKILFGFGRGWGGGHWGGHHRHYYWKKKMEERLKNMTPEERDKFRAEWKQRCGRWGKSYDWGEEKKEAGEVRP
jgi:hypothetical protein